jgi:hypothetical protein
MEQRQRPGVWINAIAAAIVTIGALAACEQAGWPTSSISIGDDGLRTYETFTELPDGTQIACGSYLSLDPVTGVLAGDPEAPEPIWLEHDGRRLSVIWPRGFTVGFEPEATLRNETGAIVARAGDEVEFTQVDVGQAAGTYEDPYIAGCDVFGTEYIYIRPGQWDGPSLVRP